MWSRSQNLEDMQCLTRVQVRALIPMPPPGAEAQFHKLAIQLRYTTSPVINFQTKTKGKLICSGMLDYLFTFHVIFVLLVLFQFS